MNRRRRPLRPTATPFTRRGRAAAVAIPVLIALAAGLHAVAGSPEGPRIAAATASGGGWHDWWSAHGKEVATVVGCFLDGVVAARWLALGGTGMAAAGLVAAAIACFA